MPSSGFSITISATDGASKVIENVNRRFAAMRAPAERLSKSLSKFADVSGLRGVSEGFSSIASTALNAMRNVARIVEPLAAISGALSLAGMYKLVQAWSSFGSSLGFAAQRIGITAGQLQTLQGASLLAGSSAESMTQGLQNLGQTMYDAIGGRAPEAANLFNMLGVAFDDGTRHARKVIDVLPELADKIAAIKDPRAQAQLANAFGLGDLLPLLRKGAAGIAEYTKKARAFGVFNQAGVDGANRMREAMAGVQLAVAGLTNSIAEKLAPILTPLLGQMSQWIAANRMLIADWIGVHVQELADYLKTVDFGQILKGLEGVWHTADGVAQAFGGWKTVVEGLIALKFAGYLTALVGGINPVTAAVLALTAAYIANSSAYDDFIRKRKGFKAAGDAKKDLQDRVDALPPEKRAEFMRLQAQHGGTVTDPGLTPLDAQRRAAGLPTGIGQAGNAADMVRAFAGMGYTPDQAAGMAANLQAESGGNPFAVGDKGSAYGLGQWHADRQAYYAKLYGHTMQSVQDPVQARREQLQFMDQELHTTEKGALQHLQSAHTPYEAGAAISQFYERPGARDEAAIKRGNMAAQIASNGGGAVEVRIHAKISGDGTVKTTSSAKTTGKATAPPPKVETSPIFT